MDVVPINKKPNDDAIEMLELAISRLKSGEIRSIAISWVTEDNSIGGDISKGDNIILMWASIEHTARSFYENCIGD